MGTDPSLVEPLEEVRQNMSSLPDITAMYNDRSGVKNYEILPSHMGSDAVGGAFVRDDKTMYFHKNTVEGNTMPHFENRYKASLNIWKK